MTKLFKACRFVFALCSASSALAADWRHLSSGTSGVEIYVDVESPRTLPPVAIRRPFAVSQIWVLWDFREDRSVPYRERRTLERFDCDAELQMTVSAVTYDPAGNVTDSWSEQDYDFKYHPVTPGTLGYAIMEFACGRRSVSGLAPDQ